MKPHMNRYAVLLLFLASLAHAQPNVYVCQNADGSREYKTTGDGIKGCRPIDMQGISLISRPSLGMSKSAIQKSWGRPDATRRIQTRKGITEEWRYTGRGKLTFQNGILEVIGD
jgi:hypothetical protein